jgi:DNA repair protein RecO (recombination protein O)
VLRTQELGETDLIVSLLAEHHGRVRGVARAARKSRKRFGGVLEPLTRVHATWVEKEGRELHRLDAMDSVRSFAAMQADPALQAVCAVLAEVTEAFCREGQPEERGFKLLGAVLEALEGGASVMSMVRYFEYWTLWLHGLLPDLSSCARCSAPLPANETKRVVQRMGILCRECLAGSGLPGLALSEEAARFLDAARRNPPRGMPAGNDAVRAGGALEALLRGTLESFAERPFRTYRHLRASEVAPRGKGNQR